ncbi:MAG: urea transporter [Verrucomicrobiae bacterium]|nr:urea transporter [Verrucomicrobiae bacterium]
MSTLATSINQQIGYTIIIVLGLIWVALGLYWGRKAKDSESFMLAGRNVGLSLGAATAMATWVTSNTMMVAPLLALNLGIWGMLAYACASFGLMLFAPLSIRIKKLLPNGYTSGDFFRQRYGRVGWSLFLVITLVYSVTWLVTMAIAGGKLLETLGAIPYLHGMTAIMAVCVLYTIFGGLYAVIGTDFIQSLIILIGVVAIGLMVFVHLDFGEIYAYVSEYQPSLLKVVMPVALLAFFNNMLFGFGEVFHNNVWWSRAFAMRKEIAPKAFFISGLLWFPIPIAAGFIAIAAGPLGVNVTDPSKVGPDVAEHVLSEAGMGAAGGALILVVLFCSIASSIDSLLAATSDLLVKDVYCGLFQKKVTDKSFRRIATTAILIVALISWALAISGLDLDVVLFSAGGLVASLIWPIIAGLFWKGCNRALVLAGIVLGVATGYYFYFEIETYTGALAGGAVSMVFTILSYFIHPKPFPEPDSVSPNVS